MNARLARKNAIFSTAPAIRRIALEKGLISGSDNRPGIINITRRVRRFSREIEDKNPLIVVD